MSTLGIILLIFSGIILLILSVLLIRTARVKKPVRQTGSLTQYDVDGWEIAKRLSGAIQFQTIATESLDTTVKEPFLQFHQYLKDTYPLIHRHLTCELVNELSLLYKWKGSDPSKKPIILLSHQDVVPVEEHTIDQWLYPPWSGKIADGYVWGRGALDMKGHLIAKMEAIEYLLSKGFTPKCDIYFALGHDEEQRGLQGGANLAKRLQELGVSAEYVLDEGGTILDGKEFGVNQKIAAVAIAEKVMLNLKLTATSAGGHSSMPPKQTAVGQLCRAVLKLEKAGFAPFLNDTAVQFFHTLCPYMNLLLKIVWSNLWLFTGLFFRIMDKEPKTRALLASTVAPTMLEASNRVNVLAHEASAVINFRLIPGVSVEEVIHHMKKVAGDRVLVEVIYPGFPCSTSSTTSRAWNSIKTAIHLCISPHIIVAPYLMLGATDSRWYQAVAENIYRFDPFVSAGEDIATMHAIGERISVESLKQGTDFFIHVLTETAG